MRLGTCTFIKCVRRPSGAPFFDKFVRGHWANFARPQRCGDSRPDYTSLHTHATALRTAALQPRGPGGRTPTTGRNAPSASSRKPPLGFASPRAAGNTPGHGFNPSGQEARHPRRRRAPSPHPVRRLRAFPFVQRRSPPLPRCQSRLQPRPSPRQPRPPRRPHSSPLSRGSSDS